MRPPAELSARTFGPDPEEHRRVLLAVINTHVHLEREFAGYESLGPQGAPRRRSGGAKVQPAAFDQMNVPLAVYHRIRMFVTTV